MYHYFADRLILIRAQIKFQPHVQNQLFVIDIDSYLKICNLKYSLYICNVNLMHSEKQAPTLIITG